MNYRPSMQFYPADWLKDPELQICSMNTIGIWMNILCRMWEAKQEGVLSGTPGQLALLVGANPDEFTQFLTEINDHRFGDIRKCNGTVTITCRRMKQAFLEREGTKSRVSKHRSKKKQNCNGNVQECNNPSSSSTTISSTSTTNNNTNIYNPHCGGKPTNEQVKEYADSIGYPDLDAEGFVAYYESRGWLVSQGQQVMDWRPLVTTWKKNRSKFDANDRATSTNSGKRYQSQGRPEDGSETDWDELKRRAEKKTV